MHPLYCARPVPYVPVCIAPHRYTYAPPRCKTSQNHGTFIPKSVSLWNDVGDPYSMVCDLRVSRAGSMPFYWPS